MTYLKVEEHAISPTPCLALANDDSGHGYERGNKSVTSLLVWPSSACPALLPRSHPCSQPLQRPRKEEITRTLLPELWLSLLDRAKDHVAGSGSGQTVKTRSSAVRLDDEERLGAAVVRAVEHGARGQTEGHAVLVTGGTDD